MNVLKPVLVSAGVVAGMAAVSFWAWPHTPALTAVHWGADGTPDQFGSRLMALGMLPAVTFGLSVLLAVLPSLMPANSDLNRSKRAYTAVWLALLGFMAVLHVAIVAFGMGDRIDVTRIAVLAIGVLLLVLGNYLGKVRYNYVFGLRLPWTLASERVWDRTHHFAGPLVMAGGAILAVIGLAAPDRSRDWLPLAILICTLVPILVAGVYSWRQSRL